MFQIPATKALILQLFASITIFVFCLPFSCFALSSANIPLDSPIYSYLDKLAGLGLVSTDIKGIKPYSKAEAARLLLEAKRNLTQIPDGQSVFANDLIGRIRELIPREAYLLENPDKKTVTFDYNPISSIRLRNILLDGTARNYQRDVHDPGNDGVFGIGSGLRPANPYPSPVHQRGSEGTPLFENNNGVIYGDGYSAELRWGVEFYWNDDATAVLEPSVLLGSHNNSIRFNKGYLKIGGKSIELEAGKDENWLGPGYRGNITLTNNADNFTQLKLSSPEPLSLPYLGGLKYSLIASRFERSITDGVVRQPWFYAVKLSVKPSVNLEIGFNLGRQVAGPGVNNSVGDSLRGLIGGTSADNSNGLAGFDLRYRIPWLRNSEIYAEMSGEDTATFWPIVESYVAGIYMPHLTDDGRNDFRFEFFQGNQILYTHATFPGGYIYRDMPLGHSQGGATQDFLFRGTHWFGSRNNLALEYIYTNRGMTGRIEDQTVERKHAGRIFWDLPLYGDIDGQFGYGYEKVSNLNLKAGTVQNNQFVKFELRYRY
jgi:hypothetical protein